MALTYILLNDVNVAQDVIMQVGEAAVVVRRYVAELWSARATGNGSWHAATLAGSCHREAQRRVPATRPA